jgi:hypothetical protein
MSKDAWGRWTCQRCDPAVRGSRVAEPDRKSWAFAWGRRARDQGQEREAPFLAGTVCAASWFAGWDDAEEYARNADRLEQLAFDLSYCPPE